MSALSSDFTGCSILIYDAVDNNHICSTIVTHYEKNTMRIQIEIFPQTIEAGKVYRLLILSAPTPCEYQGRVFKDGSKKTFAMYQGREKENRGAARYKLKTPALIEKLIFEGQPHPLHTPLKVELINISKSGVRFRAQNNALSDGDQFQMRLTIGENEKLLIAEVINHMDKDTESSEYGCRFLMVSE